MKIGTGYTPQPQLQRRVVTEPQKPLPFKEALDPNFATVMNGMFSQATKTYTKNEGKKSSL